MKNNKTICAILVDSLFTYIGLCITKHVEDKMIIFFIGVVVTLACCVFNMLFYDKFYSK